MEYFFNPLRCKAATCLFSIDFHALPCVVLDPDSLGPMVDSCYRAIPSFRHTYKKGPGCRVQALKCTLQLGHTFQILTFLQQLKGPIETTLCDYESVENVNEELYSNLTQLVRLPFFKYFRVRLLLVLDEAFFFISMYQLDLYRECPFWPDDGSCNNIGCAITTVDEVCCSAVLLIYLTRLKSNIPVQWRASTLSKVDENTTSDKVSRVHRRLQQ